MAFEKAVRILEFDKVLGMLAACAKTSGAKELALSLRPETKRERVEAMLRQTTEAKKYIERKGTPPFGGAADVRNSADRAVKGAVLSIRELLDIASVLRAARSLLEYSKQDFIPDASVNAIFDRLYFNKNLENRILSAFLSEDSVSDDASPALADVRRKMRSASARVKDTLQKYVNSPVYTKYLQENIITIRNGRYVIPVKQEYRNEIRGLVHDTSSSGSTLFIEPMPVVDANNELRELEIKERNEIEKVLAAFSYDVSNIADALIRDYENITELAFIFAKGQLSIDMNGDVPVLSDDGTYELKKARHPLLDKEKVVPISLSLGKDHDTLVITGPNTGGKTVTLKTTGLLALMAQSGLHIPASGESRVCVFDDVFADIGDEQSIEQSLSTFSAHMVNIIGITSKVRENTLVLFDELGAGTDPVEGAALAISILEYVRKKGALCAATTHYAELKAYALENEGVTNGSCEFDVETLKPTYRLIIGAPGKSNAFEISQRLGLKGEIVDAARGYVSSENKEFESVIDKLDRSRLEMEKERSEAARLRAEFEAYKAESEKRIADREARAEEELKKARETAARILGSARATSDYVLETLDRERKKKESELSRQSLESARDAIRARLRNADDEVDPVVERRTNEGYVLPRELKLGDEVLIVNLNKLGKVTKLPNAQGKVEVTSGSMTLRTELSNLILNEGVDKVEEKKKRSYASATNVMRREFQATLDLRGNTGDDAWFMTDKYLDEAKMLSVNTVTLLHGKGTGALRAALWQQLRRDKRVKSFRAGKYGEGDYGVTIVELK